MNPQSPEECRQFFETLASGHDCVITKFDFANHIVEFNGADDDLERLARAIADRTA